MSGYDMTEKLKDLLRDICTVACMICCSTDSADYMAKELIKHGAFLPPCKVGATVFVLLEEFDDERWSVSEEWVTEVGTRGVWISGALEPKEDMETFLPCHNMGTEWFTDRAAAESALQVKEVRSDEMG